MIGDLPPSSSVTAFTWLEASFITALPVPTDPVSDTLRIAGWRESARLALDDLCGRLAGLPCPAVLATDVERDGALAGPNLDLARPADGQ